MTEDSGNKDEEKEPPKIKIGLGEELENLQQPGTGGAEPKPKGKTAKLEVPAGDAPSAEVPGEAKKGTSRIDVSKAVPPAAKHQTSKIDLSQVQQPTAKKGTSRIDADSARPPKEKDLVTGKSSTSRISLANAVPPSDADAPTAATTLRVPPASVAEGIREAEVPDAAKNTTQRIVIRDDAAGGTIPLPGKVPLSPAADPKQAKARTSRIELPSRVEEPDGDILKKRTARVSPDDEAIQDKSVAPPTAPRTIRLTPPATVRTIAQPRPPDGDTPAEDRKSATARLDLPPEHTGEAPTRPKTIRIKRPDGTSARRPLSIARASEERKPVLTSEASMSEALEVDDVPGALYVALTTIALLVAGVLVYVLLAQTYALDLSFPGRL